MLRITIELDAMQGADDEIRRQLRAYMGRLGPVTSIRMERLSNDVARTCCENAETCGNCRNCEKELWPRQKVAFRCFADGIIKGRIITTCPAGYERAELEDRARPIWCPGFEKRIIEEAI